MKKKYSGNLSFLNEMLSINASKYEMADWLISDFYDLIWKCDFGEKGKLTLDFQYLLENSIVSLEVISTIKYWLIITTQPTNGGLSKAIAGQHFLFSTACAWVDYLILNEEHFNFSTNGFSLLTPDAFLGALEEICSYPHRHKAIYKYEEKIITLALQGASTLTENNVKEALNSHPVLGIVCEDIDTYNLTHKQIIKMRVWLNREGLLRWNYNWSFKLNDKKISEIFYKNTLRGISASKPDMEIFRNKKAYKTRKHSRIATTAKREISEGQSSSQGEYVLNIRSFRKLSELSLYPELLPPLQTITTAEERPYSIRSGRFKSLPAEVVFDALKGAIEFNFEYGDAIVDAYIALLKKSQRDKKSIESFSEAELRKCLGKKLLSINISRWAGRTKAKTEQKTPFGSDLSLMELTSLHRYIKILYGSTAMIVGTLMARRQGELLKLDSKDALSVCGRYLIFGNGKSTRNLGGLRESEARPIIDIASQAIKRIQRIHGALRELGHLNTSSKLFQHPIYNDPKELSSMLPMTLNSCLDCFCDHIETAVVEQKRYYLRQHQLRRFFCMVFFWHRSFAGLDNLRWFLGHHDMEQIYRYITESTPGAVLRNIKAQYASENIAAYSNLKEYLAARFKVEKFALLETNTLEAYIDILLEEGNISIEPTFFEGSDGQDYKILVKIIDNGPKTLSKS